MLIAKDTSGEFPKLPLPEAGTTQAVCCAVWDLGLQKATYMGKEKIQHKIIIAWEITEKINAPDSEYHGKPYMLNKRYTLSLGDKANLRKDLESWRGKPFNADELAKGFDLEKLYGVNCLLGIKHVPDSKDASIIYANVSAILPTQKSMPNIQPLRTREEPPPKWVIEKQAQAVKVADEINDPFPELGGGFADENLAV
jgi:hypothetical protein